MTKQTSTADLVKVFLLGMIVALLGVLALRPDSGSVQAAGGGGAAGPVTANGLIALTGPGDAALFLIDPVNKYIAQYDIDNARFSLRAARYFKNDLYIKDINRKGGIDIDLAEKEAKKSMKDD